MDSSRRIVGLVFAGTAPLLMLVATFLAWGGADAEEGSDEAVFTYTTWEWKATGEDFGESDGVQWTDPEMDFVRGKGLIRAGGIVLIAAMSVLFVGAVMSIIGFFQSRGLSLVAGVAAALGSVGMLTASGLLVAGFIRFNDFLAGFAEGQGSLSGFRPMWGMIPVAIALGRAAIGSFFLFSRGREASHVPPEAVAPAPAPLGGAVGAEGPRGSPWTRLRPSNEMQSLVCPQCKSAVQVPAGARPACWTCGFSG